MEARNKWSAWQETYVARFVLWFALRNPRLRWPTPKAFNERLSGDTFHVWDSEGKKFSVTHFIDGLTDYQVGDATVDQSSTFAREVLWYAVFGPPDLLITDGGTEFAGSVQVLNELFGRSEMADGAGGKAWVHREVDDDENHQGAEP